MLQGKLPFAGVEWAGSNEDLTDDDKQTSDSNLLAQEGTITKPQSGEEGTNVLTTTGSKMITFDKPLATTDSNIFNSDDSTASFDVVSGHNMNREELMKALFEDNTTGDNTKQITGQNNAQTSNSSDSHYNPDDWVDIPNDELM